MIIEIPGCEFRVCGGDCDWQIQYPYKSDGAPKWRGKYFYSALEHALEKAYELMLQASPAKVDLKACVAECKRVKTALVKETRAALDKGGA